MVNRAKNTGVLPVCLGVLAACLLAAGLTAALLLRWHEGQQFALLDGFCTALAQRAPQSAGAVCDLVKAGAPAFSRSPGMLAGLGYDAGDLAAGTAPLWAAAGAGLALGLLSWLGGWWLQRRHTARQLRRVTGILEAARAGKPLPLWEERESLFSPLADEIGKTVGELARTRQAAVAARDRFARNLANIAHQLKTPLTALALAAQDAAAPTRRALEAQIGRLTGLEEALLLLARLDSGTLPLHPAPADLFTLLTMAADQLQPLARRAGVTLDVPEQTPVTIEADPDWTVEALMNLIKNCLEHSPPGGAVHCLCTSSALYTEVRIRDEGNGFSPEDLPHLFDRFYRGAGAGPGGVGIGLSIAKELLERQNAVLAAENPPEGGGQFTVRFYPPAG